MSKRPHVSKPQSAPSSSKKERTHTKGANTGPIAFFIALFVIAVGSIQIISAFHTYAINLSELNSLKKQEAVLAAQKKDLENDIARWDDPAYVTAQARERLGYVFPGEQAIKVEHPEAVSGEQPKSDANANTETGQSNLPGTVSSPIRSRNRMPENPMPPIMATPPNRGNRMTLMPPRAPMPRRMAVRQGSSAFDIPTHHAGDGPFDSLTKIGRKHEQRRPERQRHRDIGRRDIAAGHGAPGDAE